MQYWVSVLLAVYGAALVAASRTFLATSIQLFPSLLTGLEMKQSAAGLPTIPIRAVYPFSWGCSRWLARP